MPVAEIVDPQDVAHALGLRRKRYSLLDYSADITRGFPVSAVETLMKAMALDRSAIARLVASEATLKRHYKTRKPLSADQSERLARLAEVWATALDVYQNRESARTFLLRPHQLLHGREPLAVAAESSAGLRSVVKILGRLKYGTAA
jgi:putative toxin-antitoxin system antitoxin component (TIGR02293 family)